MFFIVFNCYWSKCNKLFWKFQILIFSSLKIITILFRQVRSFVVNSIISGFDNFINHASVILLFSIYDFSFRAHIRPYGFISERREFNIFRRLHLGRIDSSKWYWFFFILQISMFAVLFTAGSVTFLDSMNGGGEAYQDVRETTLAES